VSPEGDVDEAALRARAVTYDEGADAQARTKVTVGGGRLVRNDPPHNTGQPVDTAESVTFFSGLGREIFVVSPDGAIHMSSHKIGQYHHSSLLAAGGVVMAGEMAVTGGTITAMSNKSGHYEPTARQFRQFLRRLKREGVALTFPITGWGVKDGPAEAFASGSGK